MRLAATLLAATALTAAATAAPITVLERNGAYVAVEAYGPNVVHVTIATDKKEIDAGPGYGILAAHADHAAFIQTSDAAGDSFASTALKLTIPAEKTHVRSVMENYFVSELPNVRVLVANAAGKPIVAMTGGQPSPTSL